MFKNFLQKVCNYFVRKKAKFYRNDANLFRRKVDSEMNFYILKRQYFLAYQEGISFLFCFLDQKSLPIRDPAVTLDFVARRPRDIFPYSWKNASLVHLSLRHQNSLLAEMLLVRIDVIAVTISRTVPRTRRRVEHTMLLRKQTPACRMNYARVLGKWSVKIIHQCTFYSDFIMFGLWLRDFQTFLFKTVEWLKVQSIYGYIVLISVVVFKAKSSRRADITNVVIKKIRKRNI